MKIGSAGTEVMGHLTFDGYLLDLSGGATNGQALVYDSGTSRFKAATVAAGGTLATTYSATTPANNVMPLVAGGGAVVLKYDALAAVITDGLLLENTTSATGGVPLQLSPALSLYGSYYGNATLKTNTFNQVVTGEYFSAAHHTRLRNRLTNAAAYGEWEFDLNVAGAVGLTLATTSSGLGSTPKKLYIAAGPSGGGIEFDNSASGFSIWSAAAATLGDGTGTLEFRVSSTVTTLRAAAVTNSIAFNGGATATSASSFDLSGSTGAFKTPTGLSTFGGSGNSFTNGVSITPATNQITLGAAGHVKVISSVAPANASDTLTIPDTGGNDTFAFLAKAQTFTGACAFPSSVTVDGSAVPVRRANASETLLSTTGATDILDYTTTAAGNFMVMVTYRVTTGTTNVGINITYTDQTGAQTQEVVPAATSCIVQTYTGVPIYINSATASHIKVTATAGTANRVYVSATIVGF